MEFRIAGIKMVLGSLLKLSASVLLEMAFSVTHFATLHFTFRFKNIIYRINCCNVRKNSIQFSNRSVNVIARY